jgi:N-acetylneuraminic acid mutarotase
MTKVTLAIFSFVLALLLGAQTLIAQNEGAWTVTGNMQSARESGAAVPLGSGALVIGGWNGVTPVASAEIYDPSTGRWKLTGHMATARMSFPAVVLQDGKVLVEGGSTKSTVLAGAELYDPATGTWSPAGRLAVARAYHTATLLQDGKVLVTGGCPATICNISTQIGASEVYNPATNKWTTVGSLNTARSSHTATLLNNGQVLVVGGYGVSPETASELYDPTTGAWTDAPSIGTRYKHAATLLPDGTVLITGGTLNTTALYETAIYDPTTNAWKSAGFMNSPHFSHTATLLTDGTVLVASGANAYTICGRRCLTPDPTVIAEIYDPDAGTFVKTGNLNQARYSQMAALLGNGQLLTAGGAALNNVALKTAEFYVPLTLSISSYSLNFSFQQVGVTSPSQTVTVANASDRTVTFTSIAASGDYAETNTCPTTLTPGQNCAITVSFTPTVAGTRNGAVTLVDDSLGSPSQTIALTGIGEVNAISFSPSSLNFGNQLEATSSHPMSVTLVNDGATTVNISSIAISPADGTFTQTNNCPGTLPANQSCTLQIVFTPPDVGPFNETVLVTDNAPNSPQKLPLSGTGLPN